MEATVTPRHWMHTKPPQLLLYFCRRTISPFTHAVERAYLIVNQPDNNIIFQSVWDEETTRMLSYAVAGHVRTEDFASLVLAFRRYTTTVLHRFPINELSKMEFFSVIEIPPVTPSISANGLYYYSSVPLETDRFFYGGEDEGDGDEPPPTAAAAEEPDVCPICLGDFDVPTEVLQMPCRHIFHDTCLIEWQSRKNTCPLCRSMLLP